MQHLRPTPMRGLAVAVLLGAGLGAAAQGSDSAPLSVIDWLDAQSGAATPAALTPQEPPAVTDASVPAVSVDALGEAGPRRIGLVPPDVTGLPPTLWVGSDTARLTALMAGLPDLNLPAAQSLLYTVLLAEADAPGNRPSAGDALALARVDALVARGALDPALSLIEQAGVTTSPGHFDRFMRISLLTGTEDRACAVLGSAPHLSRDYAVRIFCDARARRWEDAALTFNSAQALDLVDPETLVLLARFLDPESVEGTLPRPDPRRIDPLSFRLLESIGAPMPITSLPRAFAVANLRDLAGWKSQIEAAERLTRAGALPDNHLLGLYTDRIPAASGGVWDRVAALQRFETALGANSAEAVAKTLPDIWAAMRDAELEVSFAALFAPALADMAPQLGGTAARIAGEVMLLSPDYERAARAPGQKGLAADIALGAVGPTRPDDPLPAALHAAFTDAPPRADLVALAEDQRLGEAILRTLSLLHAGARGNPKALAEAIATLRALGLEDTARRAGIQLLLLER